MYGGLPTVTPLCLIQYCIWGFTKCLGTTIMPQFRTVFADPLKNVSEDPLLTLLQHSIWTSFIPLSLSTVFITPPQFQEIVSGDLLITSSTTNLQYNVCYFTCDKA